MERLRSWFKNAFLQCLCFRGAKNHENQIEDAVSTEVTIGRATEASSEELLPVPEDEIVLSSEGVDGAVELTDGESHGAVPVRSLGFGDVTGSHPKVSQQLEEEDSGIAMNASSTSQVDEDYVNVLFYQNSTAGVPCLSYLTWDAKCFRISMNAGDFARTAAVRYTVNNWITHDDLIVGTKEGIIDIPLNKTPVQVEFAMYVLLNNGETVWNNNFGRNYRFDLLE